MIRALFKNVSDDNINTIAAVHSMENTMKIVNANKCNFTQKIEIDDKILNQFINLYGQYKNENEKTELKDNVFLDKPEWLDRQLLDNFINRELLNKVEECIKTLQQNEDPRKMNFLLE